MLSDIIIEVAAVVTAGSATTTAVAALATYRLVRKHDRILFGEPEVDEFEGIVDMVGEHRAVIDREGLL